MIKAQSLPMSRIPSRKSSFISQIFFTVIFYITLFLYMYPSYINAGVAQNERGQVFLSGISIIVLIVAGGTAFFFDEEFRRLLSGKIAIIYGAVVFIYLVIGWRVYGNSLDIIKGDILVLQSPILGLAMFRLIVKSCYPKLQLLVLIIAATFLVYYSMSQAGVRLHLAAAGIEDRSIDLIGFPWSALLMIPSGIAIGILSRSGWIWAISIWGSILVHVYSVSFLAATRSSTLAILAVVASAILSLSYRVDNGVITNQLSFLRLRRLIPIFFLLCTLLFFAIFSDFIFNLISFLENSLLFGRFFGDGSAQQSSEARIQEATEMIESLQGIDWLLGRGIGANFRSFMAPQAPWPHIGILTFLLKGGLVLFIPCVYVLYIKFPRLFIKAVLKPKTLEPRKRTAILTVLPGVFGWATLLLLSGGYSSSDFFGVGFGLGAYLHIRKYGLNL
ncbi:MAG: hypothetical protein IM504_10470 [Microcystis sp. M038S2]|jgi:hypothetical protein|uniref:hypothetical protein n=1 Tax=unclassified Microcystis TaxID=2643300 RepID=UPI00118F70F4|nr:MULTISPECIES: hypothetical protein [unclassified Microcystis]NCS11934.1 hypothetical protein [Microcystis aeruginosa G13-09]TRU56152.1 MAG: hypothetical protein EWV48_20835 [Microcystis aeruginosa Ma_QC_C_20070823_S13]TRU61642.1 MAG: hypothetical protein EWV56_08645 [Microcystis aeruginosa Ma_QC_C_20070823_S13D]MCA2684015.1 hypothetical protein [Microcystis sp. M046S2]MCA2705270.1 hypothetical protein [Microcystis sp. M038S2]